MTDLYGVRVLAVDPPRRRIRLRVTVIYYDIGSHAPLTDDASFYLRLFGETAVPGVTGVDAPLGDVITQDQLHDEAWVDANTRWFVESVRRVATRNHPMTEEVEERLEEERVGFPWEDGSRFHEMSPEAAADLVLSEETNVGADYDVVVTDPRWIEHLSVGGWWRTASYPTHADRLLAGEATAIPDLRDPAAVLKPFGADDEPRQLAFSDDGRSLTVTSEEGESVVYDTTNWRACRRTRTDDCLSPGPTGDGRVLDVIESDDIAGDYFEGEDIEIHSQWASPGGEYLALSVESPGKLEVVIQRVDDHQVVTRHAIGRGWYPLQTYELAWSPDGRWLAANLRSVNRNWETNGGETHIFRIGLPTDFRRPTA